MDNKIYTINRISTFTRNNCGFTKNDSENVDKMWTKCGENVEKNDY